MDKVVHDLALEAGFKACHVVLYSEMPCNPQGIVDRGGGTVPEFHGYADYLVPGLLQERCRNRGIDPAAHGDSYFLSIRVTHKLITLSRTRGNSRSWDSKDAKSAKDAEITYSFLRILGGFAVQRFKLKD
jgi:hypothetical protein